MFWKPWVPIPALYTSSTFSHYFFVKIVIFVWKDKNKQKRGLGWPIFCKKSPRLLNFGKSGHTRGGREYLIKVVHLSYPLRRPKSSRWRSSHVTLLRRVTLLDEASRWTAEIRLDEVTNDLTQHRDASNRRSRHGFWSSSARSREWSSQLKKRVKMKNTPKWNKAGTCPRSAARFKPEVHPRSVAQKYTTEVN